MHYFVGIVVVLALLLGIMLGRGCSSGGGDGIGGSDSSKAVQPTQEVTPEPPVVVQTKPVVVHNINKIFIERKDGKNFIRFDDNEPQPVNDKAELTQLFEKSLPQMNDSVEVVGNGLEEFYREVILLLESNNKKIIYSKQ